MLKSGTISRVNAIQRITNLTSSNVFPPSISPIISFESGPAKKKQIKNETTENAAIILVASLYILTFFSVSPSASYSLASLQIANGIPTLEIVRKIL